MLIEIKDNEMCWCGSENVYASCCKELIGINNDVNFLKVTNKSIDNKNYDMALKYCRADLTQYFIYVKSHTEPLIFLGKHDLKPIIEMDVKVLSEILGRLMEIIYYSGIEIDFEKLLIRSKSLFFNDRWYKRLDYHFIAWKYLVLNDRKSAIEYIEANVKWVNIQDADFLEIYIDLYLDNLSFSEKCNVLNKVISMEKSMTEQIHYKGVLALEYFSIGDEAKAIQIFNDVVDIYHKNEEKCSSSYDHYIVANAFSFFGKITDNIELKRESARLMAKTVKLDSLTAEGYSKMFWHMGLSYIDTEEYDKAINSLELSIKYSENQIARIFMALVHTYQKGYDSASTILEQIDYDSISMDSKVDYLFVYAYLLLNKKDKTKMEVVIDRLRKVKVENLYFETSIKDIIIDLFEAYKDYDSENNSGILNKLNRYLLLEPNFCGLGVNINNIISDFIKRKKKS